MQKLISSLLQQEIFIEKSQKVSKVSRNGLEWREPMLKFLEKLGCRTSSNRDIISKTNNKNKRKI